MIAKPFRIEWEIGAAQTMTLRGGPIETIESQSQPEELYSELPNKAELEGEQRK